jgi:hypothetical protein
LRPRKGIGRPTWKACHSSPEEGRHGEKGKIFAIEIRFY